MMRTDFTVLLVLLAVASSAAPLSSAVPAVDVGTLALVLGTTDGAAAGGASSPHAASVSEQIAMTVSAIRRDVQPSIGLLSVSEKGRTAVLRRRRAP
ncbi:hypothetical protein VV01_20985 [Luteipulveratus halotolerans]|uniref:Secreted protein n=1 Tax=Luteipulveratus halotolerans TaxID=1631356 RepID=A0A0L6CN24_9MICO|nr:hypothetical protein VV01_20985 [Luteipulveratus halotolerans]